ncbi:MAG: hypothetical protein JWN20_895 [Jatrophihabitantaceae bacterium]|nr:hypothetical protein [Jatrophihabitantaceae bacterium]
MGAERGHAASMTESSSGPDQTMATGVEDGLTEGGDDPQPPQDQPDSARSSDGTAGSPVSRSGRSEGSGTGSDGGGPTPSPGEPTPGEPTAGEPTAGEQISGAVDPEPEGAGSDGTGHGHVAFG